MKPGLDLESATFAVRTATSQGSGYLVAPDRIATCHHVVESVGQNGDAEILLPGRTIAARVLQLDKATDCAILALAEPLTDRKPLPLAARCEPRAQWDGYGFPGVTAGAPLPFFGLVLQPEGTDDQQRPMVTLYSEMLAAGMAVAVNGLSGGPVAVDGAVIGHFSRVLGTPGAAGQPALGVVYASRAANVAALLGTTPDKAAVGTPPVARLAQGIPPLADGEYHTFISYRSTDRAFATRLYERLDAVGLRVFLDQKELVPGDQLATKLHTALGRSKSGIVLMSKAWTESRWCVEEGNRMVGRAVDDPTFRVVPLRIESFDVPDLFAGRLWVDFAGEDGPTGRKLEQVIYAVMGKPAPPEGSAESKLQTTFTDATDEALRRVAAMPSDPERLKAQVEFLRDVGLPEVATRLCSADSLVGAGRLEDALELLSGLDSARARQLRALALSRGGQHDGARELLEPLFDNGDVDAETGGILGGIYRRLWLKTRAPGYLIKSYETYRVTYARTGDPYPGINVAALALLRDRTDEAQKVAAEVLAKLGALAEAKLEFYNLASIGDAYVILGDVTKAADWYEKAVARGLTRPANIAAVRRQVRLMLPKKGKDAHALDGSLPVPPVVAFSGHLTDAPGRAIPRFPESRVDGVQRKLLDWLQAHGGTVHAVCSAARGSDLIFLETVLENEGTATVLLPFPLADFQRVSVGRGWDDRLDAVLENKRIELREPLLAHLPAEPEQGAAFQHCNVAIVEEVERLATLFDDGAPTLLTVWDGAPGDGEGGTAGMVSSWKDRGHPHDNIPLLAP